MKATEYLAKYETRIATAKDEKALTKAALDMFWELSDEIKTLADKELINADGQFISEFKALNQKWNDISVLFNKKYGWSPLVEDGFKMFWIDKMPELAEYL